MQPRPGKFDIIVLAAFAAAMAVNLMVSLVAMRLPSERSLALCAIIDDRVKLAGAAPSPKLLIIGGSSVTGGINAEIISGRLGIRAQNFGLHAGFGTGIDLFQARKVLRPGDTALLAFEYSAYAADKSSDVANDTMLLCGHDYLAGKSLYQRFKTVAGFPLKALRERLAFIAAPRPPPGQSYTPWGDLPLDAETFHSDPLRARLYRPLRVRLVLDTDGPADIARFIDWARHHEVAVIATWPNTLGFRQYAGMPGFADIRRFYEDLGVPVLGEPQMAMVRADHLSDTNYHLNAEGIRLRTYRLVAALAQRPELLASLRPGN
jgi:hypothetical protein